MPTSMKPKQSPDSATEQKITTSLRKFSKARPLAKQVGIHPRTLFRWAEAGRLHRYKLNARIIVFDEAEVAALIASSCI